MSDIVERLTAGILSRSHGDLARTARDEIVRLRNVERQQQNVIAAAWDDKKNQQARAEAAEAERDRLRDALVKIAENTATGWPAQVARAALGDTQ